MIYLLILVFLLLLSFVYDINGKVKNRDLWYNVMLVVFVLIAGLRWRIGVDTPNYLGFFYYKYPTLENFSFENYGVASSPFYVLINSIVKSLGGRFYVVQLIHSAIVNVLIFKYIKRHSSYVFTCLFFYSFICYTTYNMETMRASISIAICLFANDYFLSKNWFKGYALYFIALMFHPQAIVMFVLPLLFFLRFNKLGVLILIGAFLTGLILNDLLKDYMFLFEGDDYIENKISNYTESERYGGQRGNFNRFLAFSGIPALYLAYSIFFIKRNNPSSKILELEPFLMVGLVFILIRVNFEIAYRYVDCFKIYFILFYSSLFVGMVEKMNNKISKPLSLVRSFTLFFPIVYVFFINAYVLSDNMQLRYVPYNSVFEREINRKQQMMYNRVHSTKYYTINREKY